NKHRNFKNLPKTCAKRRQAWECSKDYNSDGSLSSCVLKNVTILQYVKPISGDTISDAAQFDLPMSPTHTAKIVKINGHSGLSGRFSPQLIDIWSKSFAFRSLLASIVSELAGYETSSNSIDSHVECSPTRAQSDEEDLSLILSKLKYEKL
ncbi:unnamed protein product, partial [Didymodactylos carnosus]